MFLNLSQRSPEWHEWRRNGVGSSDIGPLVFGNAWPYRETKDDFIWEQKVYGTSSAPTYAMNRGRKLETQVLRMVSLKMGRNYLPVCYQDDKYPFFRVSIDGMDEGKLIEIKCPDAESHLIALGGKVPLTCRPQCYYLSELTKLPLYYCSFNDNDKFGQGQQLAIVPLVVKYELAGFVRSVANVFYSAVLNGRTLLESGADRKEVDRWYWWFKEWRDYCLKSRSDILTES